MTPPTIAIVGIGGLFPAADSLDAFWHNIVNAKDAAVDIPASRLRLSPDHIYAETLNADKVLCKRACLLADFEFDPTGLNLDGTLLNRLDPLYKILLTAGQAAWADAKTERLDKSRVGVIIGNIVLPTEWSSRFSDTVFKPLFEAKLLARPAEDLPIESLNRYVAGLPASLLANALQLGQGAYSLDAACASSLYSLKYAVDELVAGRADAMLAGGVSRPDCLYTQMGFSQLNAISKSGRCRPFDQKADGLIVGEGAGIFVLKRLPDAIAQGDQIYATIAGIGLSNDIDGNIMAPDGNGQLRAMQAAYTQADWLPNQVQHIECHGTGTPVGDAVEWASLNNLWQHYAVTGECVVGSVKSNVGHLLTAAGAAALMKTLLAMKHKTLPPTANYESPATTINLSDSPFTILNQAIAWDVGEGQMRRAAISGFGFGGINAHVLLQEYRADTEQQAISPIITAKEHTATISDGASSSVADNNKTEAIAIVGMETRLGPWLDNAAFAKAVLFGADKPPTDSGHWWGLHAKSNQTYAIDALQISLDRYRIPPTELREMLPQQLLMLDVAARALADAKLSVLPQALQQRTGVFIGIELDPNTSNFHFRWMQRQYAEQWSARLGLNLEARELDEWVTNLRNAASPPLNANRTMGALGGIVASRIARTFKIGGPSFTISAQENSGLHALASGVAALRRQELDQLLVGTVDFACDPRAVQAHNETHAQSIIADAATAFVLKRHEDAVRDQDHIYALIKGIGVAGGRSSVLSDAQHAKAFAPETGIKAAQMACAEFQEDFASIDYLCHAAGSDDFAELMPAHHFALGHSGAANGLLNIASAVHLLHQRVLPGQHARPRHWLKDQADGARQILANSQSFDGQNVSVVLQEGDLAATTIKQSNSKLFAISAQDQSSLIDKIKRLVFTDQALQNHADDPYRVALLSRDHNELKIACTHVINAIEAGDSVANKHCFYTSKPRSNGNGKIAFVYPGSGNHFFGMGQALGIAFPNILEKLNYETETLATQFAQGRFWQAPDQAPLSHEEMIFSQVWLGIFGSDVVSSFNVKPDAVIGYSLGETAGLFATRTWTARNEMLQRIKQSTLFTEELAGACTAAQRTWQTNQPIDWAVAVVHCKAVQVTGVLQDYNRVYLLIINTDQECVIGGDSGELRAVIETLNVQYHPLSGITTVHCEVVKTVATAYRDLHIFATTPPTGVDFYSGIIGGRYQVTQDSAADSILEQALTCFDYTKVINSAYADGVRFFIEIGPGGSCTRMIDQILSGQSYYAESLCVPGQDSVEQLMQILARLYAEGFAVDLAALPIAAEIPAVATQRAQDFLIIKTGGQAFNVPLPSRLKPPLIDKIKQTPPPFVAKQANTLASASSSDQALATIIEQMQQTGSAQTAAQDVFLRVSQGIHQTISSALNMQMQLLNGDFQQPQTALEITQEPPCLFDRKQCLAFATSSIAELLGKDFAAIDQHPTRVRLPDEPLMLVDRILNIDCRANVLLDDVSAGGRIVTEHDILPGAWYLDLGRIPICIAVEAGQADLFLCAYMGIDQITKGLAVYRLLDAQITFHAALPTVGQTIRYAIHIDHFFSQGETRLFRFNFEASVDGKPLLTMTRGCAGFFSDRALAAGQGIVLTDMEKKPMPGILCDDWKILVPMQVEHYDEAQLNALRANDLAACFGEKFASLALAESVGLPAGRMRLVHRILTLEPTGGRFGLGQIIGEADIDADDWFLRCHFVDDKVMPGTLMYECCVHTLRIYLLRMGWVGAQHEFVYEPITGEVSQLKCRGQVTATTTAVQYEITLKAIGYQHDGTPYVLADALIYADHKAIVQIKNMSLQLTGLHRDRLEILWQGQEQSQEQDQEQSVLFDDASILAFALGKPSAAFGDRYKPFDHERKIARLPGPPYKFLDRIVAISDCEPWILNSGGIIEAEYDVPQDAWYFSEDNQPLMPFAVLLEIALQPCGWLAAYLGSALNATTDLSFRNLGGKARQSMLVLPTIGTLKTTVKITNVAQSGGMIIENFDYAIHADQTLVYQGDTYFGFFSKEALQNQVGLRDVSLYCPPDQSIDAPLPYPTEPPMPAAMMRMVDTITAYDVRGGENGLGFIQGETMVKQAAWFFKAHFYQDPVWPGSLGLESFMQLLKFFAWQRWRHEFKTDAIVFESMALNQTHQWVYRGQILPSDERVIVQAMITAIDDPHKTIQANGFLSVDGRIIYQMTDFAIRMASNQDLNSV